MINMVFKKNELIGEVKSLVKMVSCSANKIVKIINGGKDY